MRIRPRRHIEKIVSVFSAYECELSIKSNIAFIRTRRNHFYSFADLFFVARRLYLPPCLLDLAPGCTRARGKRRCTLRGACELPRWAAAAAAAAAVVGGATASGGILASLGSPLSGRLAVRLLAV